MERLFFAVLLTWIDKEFDRIVVKAIFRTLLILIGMAVVATGICFLLKYILS